MTRIAIGESSWEAKAAAKRESTLAKIPEPWLLTPAKRDEAAHTRDLTGSFMDSLIDDKTRKIVSMNSVDLVDAMRNGKLSALDVTTAFCMSAAIAHQINNCLHEIFFDQAIARAKELDAHFAKHGTTTDPLHGLPISLKDQFHVKDVDTTMGYIGWIGSNLDVPNPDGAHKIESQVVTELLSLEAILYCKTSLPQTLFFGETKNNLIGQTLNPNNQLLSCGGSSRGEGALQALRGSSLGLGTDIGGSVRIPAAFNGIFSLKPTPERISYRDVANTNSGQNTYRSTVGFLSTSVGGLGLMLSSILSTEPWFRDPAVVPLPFRQPIVDAYLAPAGSGGKATPAAAPLKLGILWTDGVVGVHPPIWRGLQMVRDAVVAAGHKMVDWTPPAQSTAKRKSLLPSRF